MSITLLGSLGILGRCWWNRRSATLFTDGRFTIQAKEEAPESACISIGPLLEAIGDYLAGRSASGSPWPLRDSRWRVGRSLRRRQGRMSAGWPSRPWWINFARSRTPPKSTEFGTRRGLGSEVMEETIRLIRPGVTELEIAAEIGYRMRRKGASGESFEAIVAAGPRSALPHARPTARRIGKNELVVLDLGAILRHYCSDLTRTVYVGRAPSRVRRWYQAVLEAQAAARDALRSGVTAGAVDAAARGVLQRKGLGRYFVHSTGHGIGLEIHEDPRLARGQKKALGNWQRGDLGTWCIHRRCRGNPDRRRCPGYPSRRRNPDYCSAGIPRTLNNYMKGSKKQPQTSELSVPGVDLGQLERLLSFMSEHGLEEFEYAHGDLRIRLKKAITPPSAPPDWALPAAPAVAASGTPAPAPAPRSRSAHCGRRASNRSPRQPRPKSSTSSSRRSWARSMPAQVPRRGHSYGWGTWLKLARRSASSKP